MAIEVKIPPAGESITEVMLSEWLVEDGEFVESDTPLCTIETDKASMELVAEGDGAFNQKVEEGAVLKVGDLVGIIDEGAEKPAGSELAKEETEVAPAAEAKKQGSKKEVAKSSASGHPSPAAAVELERKGVSPKDVKGSGKGGRITKADALNAKPALEMTEDIANEGQTRKPMSMLRRSLATRLVNVKNTTAMLTTFNEVDLSEVMKIRKKYKERFKEKYHVNLGYMSFFTKACTMAMADLPDVNAMIDGTDIVYNENVNISIAVSTKKGLVVPVIKAAETLSFAQIEKTIVDYALKARDGKISMDDMAGGTFTITNGGIFGSMLSTPIINPPQSAILGMHNIVERPIAVNGEVVIRPMMYLALSYDHRLIDGKEAVTFLVKIKEVLEDPYRYLFEL